MTSSIDLSVDELLLLQENQYPMTNYAFASIKPIGSERKIGQLSHAETPSKSSALCVQQFVAPRCKNIEEDNYFNNFEISPLTSSMKSTKMSFYNGMQCVSMEEPKSYEANNHSELLRYQSFQRHLSSSGSSTSSSSTPHSPQSSHLLDKVHYQRQTSSISQQKPNPLMSTHAQAGKTITSLRAPQNYPANQFFMPNSFQNYPRHPFLNAHQQTRTAPPIFIAPLKCTRERFQVNSIGRPVLRTNNYARLSQNNGFKTRR